MTGRAFDRENERIVLRAAEQRALDDAAVAAGVPPAELMESAGRSSADWIADRLSPARVVILVGPGGNGGDGLVVARRLAEAGVDVKTLLLQPAERLGTVAAEMLDRLERVGERIAVVEESDLPGLPAVLSRADRIVDAVFGSGLSRPLEGLHRAVVECANASDVPIVSLDLPSGLPSDCGALLGVAVRAGVTLAMEFLKPAHLLFPASEFCGNVAIMSVDYPARVLDGARPSVRVPERRGIARRLPNRRPDGHKGTFGRVLVVAGSIGMTGAAILTCRGALRAGAGLVHLAIPASLNGILEAALPETITIPLPEEDGGVAALDEPRLERVLRRADVLAVGPGLSRAPATVETVRRLIERFEGEGTIVLDADGLAAVEGRLEALCRFSGRLVLTPHPGELGRLLGRRPSEVDSDRIEIARKFAGEHGVILLLKGRPTAIGLPDGTVVLNPTGNSGLATGGSGDVLTGLIAGFAAGGASAGDSAILSAYVHGWAAELYAERCAERSMLPSDLVDVLPSALREVETWI